MLPETVTVLEEEEPLTVGVYLTVRLTLPILGKPDKVIVFQRMLVKGTEEEKEFFYEEFRYAMVFGAFQYLDISTGVIENPVLKAMGVPEKRSEWR